MQPSHGALCSLCRTVQQGSGMASGDFSDSKGAAASGSVGGPQRRALTPRVDRVLLALVLLLGALLFAPTVNTPFLFDDLMHSSMVEGTFVAERDALSLYDFVTEPDRAAYVEKGHLPWWSHPELSIRFLRPLASALRFGEQRLFGPSAPLMHLHSFLWWVLSVLSARALYRRIASARAALIAVAIFALGPWHVFPLAWIANREILLTLACGAYALNWHVRWQRSGQSRDALIALLLYVLCVATGEYAMCLAGYVVGLEWARSGVGVRKRVIGLALYFTPALIYLALRATFGYGTVASSFYIDPLAAPGQFLLRAPERAIMLLAEGWLTLGSTPWGTTLPKGMVAILVACAALALLGPLRQVAAGLPRDRRRLLLAALFGSLVAIVPVLSVAPAPRLLGASALGMSIVLGCLLDHAWFGTAAQSAPGSRFRKEWLGAVATLFAFAHFVHGPARSALSARELRQSSSAFAASTARIAADVPSLTGAQFMVLRGMGGSFFGPFALHPRGMAPKSWNVLALTGHVLVKRTGRHSIELITGRHAALYPCGRDNLFRDESEPLAVGDSLAIPGGRVTVLELAHGCPRRAALHFDAPADDIIWLQEKFMGLERLTLPEVGFGMPLDP